MGEPPRGPGWLSRLLGRGRVTTDDGVRYEPRRVRGVDGTRLAYDVRFADGQRLRINPGPARAYADLSACPRAAAALAMIAHVRPGSRVLDLPCGTGASAASLARVVGPAGAVVALDPDPEAVRFARRRYPGLPVAFERGGLAMLAGEPDGAFDAALVDAATLSSDRAAAEVARVVSRPGDVFAIAPADADPPSWPPAGDAPAACWRGGGAVLYRIHLPRPARAGPDF